MRLSLPPANLQLLVNNAGVTDGWKGLDEVTAEDMLDCFIANCIGAIGWRHGCAAHGSSASRNDRWLGAKLSGNEAVL